MTDEIKSIWHRGSPKAGDLVFCLCVHWKEQFPGSYEIFGGSIEYTNPDHLGGSTWQVQTFDDSGKGSWAIPAEDITAWCHAEDFKKFLPESE